MKEGWHNDDYLILFEGREVEEKEKEYGFHMLPESDKFEPSAAPNTGIACRLAIERHWLGVGDPGLRRDRSFSAE